MFWFFGWEACGIISFATRDQLREFVMYREAWGAAIHGIAKSRTRLSNWTELNYIVRQSLNRWTAKEVPEMNFWEEKKKKYLHWADKKNQDERL